MQEKHIYIHIIVEHVFKSQKYHELQPCYDRSACENVAIEWCEKCGHTFCAKHRYRYDFLTLWGSLWKESGYPPAMDLCQECCKTIQEAKRYHQKLSENGGIINEAGYFIVREHLEALETEDLKMLLNDQKAFNAKADYFYNGVFSAKYMHILYIREWITTVAYEILSRRNGV